MVGSKRSSRGYSLIELLAALVIVAVLAMVGISTLGSRSTSTVREVMDEMEGTLLAAQNLAVARSQTVTIATQGDWEPATPLFLAYDINQTPTSVIANNAASGNAYRLALTAKGTAVARDHMNAGIADATGIGQNWWADALAAAPSGRSNDDPSNGVPFNTGSATTNPFYQLLSAANSGLNLFQGPGKVHSVTISGSNKRFNTTSWVEVVSLSGGSAVPGGAMGLLVIPANGASVYKFYNPGVIHGNGHWRRI
jgi:prepilin-type N-terminal cleavage/methylation domain-containing protein